MSIKSIVANALIEDASSVWLLKGHGEFDYSDGTASEKYLEKVFLTATDLSSRSSELESYIRDWPSEYHLTSKRAQLLSGFTFDRTMKVLEVGCGCGAITRHLGESFDQVVSIEGSLNRARLARLRTRDLPSVSVVCAPFQKIEFSQKFDIIFVIGVYEYSASFVDGDEPYDAVLKYFSTILAPDGVVVIAIENQFGLKYFSGAREDHLGAKFEGIEGYRRRRMKVRTFGKDELENNIKRYFPDVRFFYPYPDYKLPDCVLSADFLASERAGEVVSQMKSRDYSAPLQPLWDEAVTVLELARNRMLAFFSNSFLVFASRSNLRGVEFDQLAVMYSSGRKSTFATETKIVKDTAGRWSVSKRSRQGVDIVDGGAIRLVNTDAPWISTQSLQTQVALCARSNDASLEEIFAPCRKWVELLIDESSMRNGVRHVEGSHIDSIWSNVYPDAAGLQIVDREWIYHRDIPLNIIVIRAIYDFMLRVEQTSSLGQALRVRSGRTTVENIANAIGVKLAPDDFNDFIKLESEIQWIISGIGERRQRAHARWFLADRPTLRLFQRSRRRAMSIASRVLARIARAADR